MMRYSLLGYGGLFFLPVLGLLSLPAASERSAAAAPEGEKAITNSIGMKLALIPAGKFQMGSPEAEVDREDKELQHEESITKPFYMGVYEVTQGEWEKVTGKASPSLFHAKKGGGPDHPVENLRWYDAVDYCQKLTALPEEKKAGRTYRLPTEAEWEYACRAGTTTPFHFGKSLSSKEANFNGNFPYGGAAKGDYLRRTAKVGSYAPNAWGLYDMYGNVAEWCSDWYDPGYYRDSPKADPKGPAKGVVATDYNNDFYRVVRGGCWLDE
ncbi:MAG TPA: formylglycine-generating enzyme family protein, partial [Gemmataceae bacterium]|nr:formylglycine-generating enzyme family protein [Gemmataceae bacterium]